MIDLEEAFREASEEMLSERGKCVRSWKKKGPYYTLVEILEKTVACSILQNLKCTNKLKNLAKEISHRI